MTKFTALETDTVRRWQRGAPDDYGLAPERACSDGDGVLCRHCLKAVPAGEDYLILAHRPFSDTQPYAETGPIFVCAEPCARGGGHGQLPPILTTSPDYLIRGYSAEERIIYGTGRVVPQGQLVAESQRLLKRSGTAFVHVRSARNNCFQLRIDRD